MRAQVSVETAFAVAAVLLIAVVVLFFTSTQNSQTDDFFQGLSAKAECQKISGVISPVSSSSASASVTFTLDNNASISGRTIIVGSYYCGFSGSALPFSFVSPGTFKASRNSQGVVSFEKIA